jgi:uncharacterized Zn finger protein (UPF0148 family)
MPHADDSTHDDASGPMDRDEIRTILADAIRALDHAIDAEPPADPGAEGRWLQRMRTLCRLAAEYRKLEKDRDLDEMAEELELLKADPDEPADH